MGVIIPFDVNRKKKKKDGLFRSITEADDAQVFKQVSNEEARRLSALVTGKLEVYTCNNCGGDIEVIDGEFPTHCPHCNVELLEWE